MSDSHPNADAAVAASGLASSARIAMKMGSR